MNPEKKPGVKKGEGVNKARGCGRWIANCAHDGSANQSPREMSGTCACHNSWHVKCPGGSCPGKDFYC